MPRLQHSWSLAIGEVSRRGYKVESVSVKDATSKCHVLFVNFLTAVIKSLT